MKKVNERNALESLINILPYITDSRYCLYRLPDEENSKSAEVDFILKPIDNNASFFAVEHTVLEGFRKQKTYNLKSYDIVKEINTICKEKLPKDRYFILFIPNELIQLLNNKKLKDFEENISITIQETAKGLKIDDYKKIQYNGIDLRLQCAGTYSKFNGQIGRIPLQPQNGEELKKLSLIHSVEHGLKKFTKYKKQGYETILVLEDISGLFYTVDIIMNNWLDRYRNEINNKIDYIIQFISYKGNMIVANIWKEKEIWYTQIPYNKRFQNKNGNWEPLEQ